MNKHFKALEKEIEMMGEQTNPAIDNEEIHATYNWFLHLLNTIGWEKSWAIVSQGKPPYQMTKDKLLGCMQAIIQNVNDEENRDEDEMLEIPKSIEDFYRICREDAWDLESTALPPFVFPETWGSNSLKEDLSDIIDEENLENGINLACTTFLFGTPVETFSNFDT